MVVTRAPRFNDKAGLLHAARWVVGGGWRWVGVAWGEGRVRAGVGGEWRALEAGVGPLEGSCRWGLQPP